MEVADLNIPVEFISGVSTAQTRLTHTGNITYIIIVALLLLIAIISMFFFFKLCSVKKLRESSYYESKSAFVLNGVKSNIARIAFLVFAFLCFASSIFVFINGGSIIAKASNNNDGKIIVEVNPDTGELSTKEASLVNPYGTFRFDTSKVSIDPSVSGSTYIDNANLKLSTETLADGLLFEGNPNQNEFKPTVKLESYKNQYLDLDFSITNLDTERALNLCGKTVFNIQFTGLTHEKTPYAKFNPSDGELSFCYGDYTPQENYYLVPSNASSTKDVPWLNLMDPSLIKSATFFKEYANECLIESTSYWFYGCSKLQTVDLCNLNVDRTNSSVSMFERCVSIHKIFADDTFNVDNISSSENMFKDCQYLQGGNGTNVIDTYDKTIALVDHSEVEGVLWYKANDECNINYSWNFEGAESINVEQCVKTGNSFNIIVPGPEPNFNPSGKAFIGWSLLPDGGEPSQFGDSVPASNSKLTMYALWETTYTVYHHKEGFTEGEYPEDLVVSQTFVARPGSLVSPDTKPTNSGDDFYGFTAPDKETVKVESDGSSHVDYYYLRNSYTVTFMDNKFSEQDPFDSQTVLFELCAYPTDKLVEKGYSVEAWYQQKECLAGSEYDFNTPITKDLTLYDKLKLNTYTIQADPNGGELGVLTTATYTVESSDIQVSDSFSSASQLGYTFANWSNSQNTNTKVVTINKDNLTDFGCEWDKPEKYGFIYAQYDANTYTIEAYNNNAKVDEKKYEYNGSAINTQLFNEVSNPGHTSKGWFTSKDGGEPLEFIDATNITKLQGIDLNNPSSHGIVYAQWSKNTFTISANPCNDTYNDELSKTSVQYVIDGDPVFLDEDNLDIPLNSGYKFDGWFNSEIGGEPITFVDKDNLDNVGCDVDDPQKIGMVYAHWSPLTFTIEAHDNLGYEMFANSNDLKYITYTTNDLPSDTRNLSFVENPGYEFYGWYDKPQDDSANMTTLISMDNLEQLGCDLNDDSVHGNIYAHWKANKYTVHFDSNDGQGIVDDQVFNRGETLSLRPNDFTKNGCSFDGWSIENNGPVVYSDCELVTNIAQDDKDEVTLYAHWMSTEYSIEFKGNGNTGGDPVETILAYEDVSVTLPENTFTKTGYKFDGWATSPEGEVVYNEGDSVKNLEQQSLGIATLYAHWSPIKYTIVFNSNGGDGVMDDMELVYDETQNLNEAKFTIPGYHVIGWATEADGEVIHNDKAPVSNLSSVDGAIVNLFAVYTKNTYTVIFDGNGTSKTDLDMQPMNFNYEESKTLTIKNVDNLPSDPISARSSYKYTKVGYYFDGWSLSKDGDVKYSDGQEVSNLTTKNNETVTLYAHWVKSEPLIKTYNKSTNETVTYWYRPICDDSIGISDVTFYNDIGKEIPKSMNNNTAYKMSDLLTATQFIGDGHFIAFRIANESYDQAFGTNVSVDSRATEYKQFKPNEDVCETLNDTFCSSFNHVPTIANVNLSDIFNAYISNSEVNRDYNFYGNDKLQDSMIKSSKNSSFGVWTNNWNDTAHSNTESNHFSVFSQTFNGGSFNVEFNGNGATSGTMSSQTILEGSHDPLKDNVFERTGYVFDGWSLEPDGNVKYIDKSKWVYALPGQILKLYARWTPINYTVKFNSNGATSGTMNDLPLIYDVGQKLPQNQFVKEHSTFLGWATESAGNVQYSDQAQVSNLTDTKDGLVNLYAVWTTNSFIVKYFDNDGASEIMSDQFINYNDGQKLKKIPAFPEGKKLIGWATSIGSQDKIYEDQQEFSTASTTQGAVINLYAIWGPATYKVRLNANGATWTTDSKRADIPLMEFTYNVPQNLTKKPVDTPVPDKEVNARNYKYTRNGYIFDGWALSENGSVVYQDEESVSNLATKDGEIVDLYAHWTQVQKLLIDYDGTPNIYQNRRWYHPIISSEAPLDGITFYDDAGVAKYPGEDGKYTMNEVADATSYLGNTPFRVYRTVSTGLYNTLNNDEQFGWEEREDTYKYIANNYKSASWPIYDDVCETISNDTFDISKGTEPTLIDFQNNNVTWRTIYDSYKNSNPLRENGCIWSSGQQYNDVSGDCYSFYHASGFWQTFSDWTYRAGIIFTHFENGGYNYNVAYDGNGEDEGNMSTSIFRSGSYQKLDKNIYKKVGYHFIGWGLNQNDDKVDYLDTQSVFSVGNASDGQTVTLYAKWALNNYYLHFDGNGATSGSMTNQQFTYNPDDSVPGVSLIKNQYVRTGYDFMGWSRTPNGTIEYDDQYSNIKNLTSENNKIIDLYAIWQPRSYTVEFNGNGNSSGSMSNQSFIYDEAKNLSENNFTKTGYDFIGWSKSSTGSVIYNDNDLVNNITDKNETVCLYAVWKAHKYSIVFNANGGSGLMANQTFNYDENKSLNKNVFVRTGYNFAGWAESEDGDIKYSDTEQIFNLTAENDVEITLYAKWAENTYILKFDANSGSGQMQDQIFTYGISQQISKNLFSKTGYTFKGWSTSSTGNATYTDKQEVKNLTDVNDDIVTFYAIWAPITYKVIFDENGGLGFMANQSFDYDTKQALYSNSYIKEGYTFTGWAKTSSATSPEFIDGQIMEENLCNAEGDEITLYAIWTNNSYTIQFNSNDGSDKTIMQAFKYDEGQQLMSTGFTRVDYELIGWSTSAEGGIVYELDDSVLNLSTVKNAVVNLYAVWKWVRYDVNFDANGGTGIMETQNFVHGEGGKLNVKPTGVVKDNNSFLGWAYTPVTEDGQAEIEDGATFTEDLTDKDEVTLYAIWKSNSFYSITIDLNGGNTVQAPDGWQKYEGSANTYYKEFNGITDLSNVVSEWDNQELQNNDMFVIGWDHDYGQVQTSITIKALWGYIVSFDTGQKATAPEQQYLFPGEKATKPKNFEVAEEYKFLNWYTDENYEKTYNFDLPVNSSFCLIAKFEGPVKVTMNLNGGLITDAEMSALEDKQWNIDIQVDDNAQFNNILATKTFDWKTQVSDIVNEWSDINPKKDEYAFYNWNKLDGTLDRDVVISAIWGYEITNSVDGHGINKVDYFGSARGNNHVVPFATLYNLSGYTATFTYNNSTIMSITAKPDTEFNVENTFRYWRINENEVQNSVSYPVKNSLNFVSYFYVPQYTITINLDGGVADDSYGWTKLDDSTYTKVFDRNTSIKNAVAEWQNDGSTNITKNSLLEKYTFSMFDITKSYNDVLLTKDYVVNAIYSSESILCAKILRTSTTTLRLCYNNRSYNYSEIYPVNNSYFTDDPKEGEEIILPNWMDYINGELVPKFTDYDKITTVIIDSNFVDAQVIKESGEIENLTSMSAWFAGFPNLRAFISSNQDLNFANRKSYIPSTITDTSCMFYNTGKESTSNSAFLLNDFSSDFLPNLSNVYKMFYNAGVKGFYLPEHGFAPKAKSLVSLFENAQVDVFANSESVCVWGDPNGPVDASRIFSNFKGYFSYPNGSYLTALSKVDASKWFYNDKGNNNEWSSVDMFKDSNITQFDISSKGICLDSSGKSNLTIRKTGLSGNWECCKLNSSDSLVSFDINKPIEANKRYLSSSSFLLQKPSSDASDVSNMDIYVKDEKGSIVKDHHDQAKYETYGFTAYSMYKYTIKHNEEHNIDVLYVDCYGIHCVFTPKLKYDGVFFEGWKAAYKSDPNDEYELIADGKEHIVTGDFTFYPKFLTSEKSPKASYEYIEDSYGKRVPGLVFYYDFVDHPNSYNITDTYNNQYPLWFDQSTKQPLHKDVEIVRFDDSFYNYRKNLYGCANWFHDFTNLKEVQQFTNLCMYTNVTDTQSMFENTAITSPHLYYLEPKMAELMDTSCNFENLVNAKNMYKNTEIRSSSGISGEQLTLAVLGSNVNSAVDYSGMFAGCKNLTDVWVSKLGSDSFVNNYSNMFSGCNCLQEISMWKFTGANKSNITGFLSNCGSMAKIELGESIDESEESPFVLNYTLSQFGINSGYWTRSAETTQFSLSSKLKQGVYFLNHKLTIVPSVNNVLKFYQDNSYSKQSSTWEMLVPHGTHLFKFDDYNCQIQISIIVGDRYFNKQIDHYVNAVKSDSKYFFDGWSFASNTEVLSDTTITCIVDKSTDRKPKAIVYDSKNDKGQTEKVMQFVWNKTQYDLKKYQVYPVTNSFLANGKQEIPSWQSYNASSDTFTPICSQPDRIKIDPDFSECVSYIDSTGKTVDLTGMAGWFAGMNNVKNFDGLGNLPVDKVKDMTNMFNGTSSEVKDANVRLDIFNKDTYATYWSSDGKVEWAKGMFKNCGFSNVVLPPRFYKNTKDVSCLFQDSNIKEFWYNGQLGNGTTYDYMFKDCKKLISVEFEAHLITSKTVKSQKEMFKGCESLRGITNFSQATVGSSDHCWYVTRKDQQSWGLSYAYWVNILQNGRHYIDYDVPDGENHDKLYDGYYVPYARFWISYEVTNHVGDGSIPYSIKRTPKNGSSAWEDAETGFNVFVPFNGYFIIDGHTHGKHVKVYDSSGGLWEDFEIREDTSFITDLFDTYGFNWKGWRGYDEWERYYIDTKEKRLVGRFAGYPQIF